MKIRYVKFLCSLCVVMLWLTTSPVRAQEESEKLVDAFKAYIDAGNIDGMLSLYGEKNEREPLRPRNYDKMRPVMQRYIDAWQGFPFVREPVVESRWGAEVVYVKSPLTDDLLKFYCRNYLGTRFVSDIEIYVLSE